MGILQVAARGRKTLTMTLVLVGLGASSVNCMSGDTNDQADEAVLATTSALTGTGISNFTQLQQMSLSGSYYLTADIDATGKTWTPIGSPFNPFTGTLDGNNHVIKNLKIASPGGYYIGMFSGTQGATIKNLGLTGVNVTCGGSCGALVGRMGDTTLNKVYVTGTVTASGGTVPAVGLVVGMMFGTSAVTRSYATGTVKGTASEIGGFAGIYDGCEMGDFHTQGFHEVFTNVSVSPTTSTNIDIMAGGLVGRVDGGWVEDISTVGKTTGRTWVGGVVGFFDAENCPPGVNDVLSRGDTTAVNVPAPGRAGPVGGWTTGAWIRFGSALYSTTTDPGQPINLPGGNTQFGYDDSTLKAPHPSPGLLINPFIHGMPQTTYPYAGSDGEWGFGYTADPLAWALNTSNQHITLLYIPNPSVQPK